MDGAVAGYFKISQSLAVIDLLAIIGMAHRFHQDIQLRASGVGRKGNGFERITPVPHADLFAIEINPREVVRLPNGECGGRTRRQRGAVKDTATTLVVGFHVVQAVSCDGCRQVLEHRRRFSQTKRRDGHHWIRRGWLGQCLARLQVFGKQSARLVKLRRNPARFTDGRVVIVAARIRLDKKTGAGMVRSRPHTERSAAVRHINAKRGPLLQHIFQIRKVTRAVAQMMFHAPRVKPARIKFAAHQRTRGLHCAQCRETRFWIFAKIHHLEKVAAQAVL